MDPEDETTVKDAGTAAPAGQKSMAAAVRAIWERSKPKVLERVQTLEAAADALVKGKLHPDLRAAAQREAHRLAGTLGTFGRGRAGERARAVELRLAQEGPFDDETIVRLCDDVVALRDALTDAPHPGGPQDATNEPGPTPTSLWFVSSDTRLIERHRPVLEANGYDVTAFGTPLEARDRLAHEVPVATVVDLPPHDHEAVLGLIRGLHLAQYRGMTLVLGDPDHLQTRVEVAHAGADHLFDRAALPQELAEALRDGKGTSRDGRTILAVDDDAGMLDVIRRVLEPDGHQVVTLDDPAAFWDALQGSDPDLVLLDHDMPSFSGLDLCRALRTERRFETVPVLFLTTDQEPGTLRRLFSAGADDFVPKPVQGPELRARVANRFRRIGAQGRGAQRDRATGSTTDAELTKSIDRLIGVADREKTVVGFALFDTGSTVERRMRDRAQRRIAAAVRQTARAEDAQGVDQGHVIAAWYGSDRTAARRRVQDVFAAAVAQESASASDAAADEGASAPDAAAFTSDLVAVVGEWPTDGTDWPTVRSTMRATLAARRAAPAGPQVVPCGWHPETHTSLQHVDVLIVDDDETLVTLVRHSLEAAGFKVAWIPDGKQAEAALVGPDAELRPRVVLLDVNLPGMDGMSLLRQLRQAGALHTMRAIMVTARSAEAEVVGALESGAVDHVSKPLSIPVLLQRVRRAMEE